MRRTSKLCFMLTFIDCLITISIELVNHSSFPNENSKDKFHKAISMFMLH